MSKEYQRLIAISQLDGLQFDMDAEVDVQKEGDEVKACPCRVCKRPVIVTRFAAPAKVACSDHKDRHAKTDAVHTLDKSKELHILTDKPEDETKVVPCRHCGRPCRVTRFASAAKVACLDCRKSAPKPKTKTEYKPNGDGNGHTKEVTTTIYTETDLEWNAFTIHKPWRFDSIFTPDEKAEQDKARAVLADHGQKRKAARNLRVQLDDQLQRTGNDKKAKKLEEEVETAQGEELASGLIADQAAERRNYLARVAYIRGAIAAGYRIKVDSDGRRTLTGRETTCPIPKNYLDAHGWKLAETKVETKAAA